MGQGHLKTGPSDGLGAGGASPDPAKAEWIRRHLQCPRCAATGLVVDPDRVACPGCGADYPRRPDGPLDFLDPGTRADFHITDTENISDHPFDGNALAIIERTAEAGGMILDCGAGYKAVTFPNVVQLEIVPYRHVDVLGINQRLPFVDACFDAVFSLDVLEHVDDPFACAREIGRVLKPGGILYVDVPFLQAEHGYPHHYYNMTRMGLVRLFSDFMDVERHEVPLSGHPMFTLHHFLHVYANGLPAAERAGFEDLRVRDILGRGPLEWLSEPVVTALDEPARWAIGSTTQGIFRKRPDAPAVPPACVADRRARGGNGTAGGPGPGHP